MFRIVAAQPRGHFRVWLKYGDGTEGEVDLSNMSSRGVLKIWDESGEFEKAYVASSGELCWSAGLDLCPDALYMKLTGKTVEELFPGFGSAEIHA